MYDLLKVLVPFIMELHTYLTQDAEKLQEEILLSSSLSNLPPISVGPNLKEFPLLFTSSIATSLVQATITSHLYYCSLLSGLFASNFDTL